MVATLVDRKQHTGGEYSIEWDGRADNGNSVGSGVYFARIEHPSGVKSHKITLLK
jgi:flagellar hook assembly protein FlgD